MRRSGPHCSLAWDFVHCPPNTEYAFVGAGERPCVIFMTGARKGPDKGIVYPRSKLALRDGAGVEAETTSPAEACAPFPKWQDGPPGDWHGPLRGTDNRAGLGRTRLPQPRNDQQVC